MRYYQPFAAPDPAAWHLAIGGLVAAPASLTLAEVLKVLPHVEQNTRLRCVEGWSARAQWGGFTYAALAGLVKPQPEATHLYFECADGYYESLPLEELQQPRALFATHMNGRLLPARYGAPLRMIFPWLYGYKGAKVVTHLEFRSKGDKGLWSTIGRYTTTGTILPGPDYPIDLDGKPRQHEGGEITRY